MFNACARVYPRPSHVLLPAPFSPQTSDISCGTLSTRDGPPRQVLRSRWVKIMFAPTIYEAWSSTTICRNIQKQPCCVLFAVEKVYTAGWRQTSNLETLLCVPRLLDGLSWSVVKRLLDAAPCGTGSSSAVSRFQLKPLGVHPPVVVTLSERSKPSYFRSCLPHTRCLKHDCRIKRDIHRMWLCSLLSAFYS